MVRVSEIGPEQYISMRRGDILSSGRLSIAARSTLHTAGLDEGACERDVSHCIDAIATDNGVNLDRRLATLAELSVQAALANTPANATAWTDAQFDLWFRAARFSYGFLFLGQRTSDERAFEDRQTQVRDYYNYSVQELTSALFRRRMRDAASVRASPNLLAVGGWVIHLDLTGIRLPEDVVIDEVIPASRLSFAGLRSIFRRDGLGAELVAVTRAPDTPAGQTQPRGVAPEGGDVRATGAAASTAQPFREMPAPNVTALLGFTGATLERVLASQEMTLSVYDPYRVERVDRRGQTVPLAANFSAGYGIWLARSGFAGQSLRTLFGRQGGIERPRVYMMQPFDPDRRIVLMLHGLASSPEAWVNVANEILGDEVLRQNFQVWQVYYPTNVPILLTLARIRRAVQQTLAHFDPEGKMAATRGMVLVGHSMGGVLARLLVSTADQNLLSTVKNEFVPEGTQVDLADERVDLLLRFAPMPEVQRAVFIAAPHRGTPFASNRLSRFMANLVRLPLTLLHEIDEAVLTATNTESPGGGPGRPGMTFQVPNSIEQLRETDPLIQATAKLPISPRVRFHSIIARRRATGPLEESDDGVVPYRSAHLAGARSELVIVSGHSVQETPQAIKEIRRILHEDVEEYGQQGWPRALALFFGKAH